MFLAKMTVNPCNKLLLLCAVFSFQLIELNTDFFKLFLAIERSKVHLWLVQLTKSQTEKLCIYVHVDLSVHIIRFYLYFYLVCFQLTFFPSNIIAVFFRASKHIRLLC